MSPRRSASRCARRVSAVAWIVAMHVACVHARDLGAAERASPPAPAATPIASPSALLPSAATDLSDTPQRAPLLPPDAAPRTAIPPITAADRAAAQRPSHGMHGAHAMHDNRVHAQWTVNRLEGWRSEGHDAHAWEAHAWIGTDLDRLWLRSEGERVGGRTEHADIQALYGRSVARWWDVVVGVRHAVGEGSGQSFAALGVMGLAPQKFDVSATVYVGNGGQTGLRAEAEYDLLLTNYWILQPLIEANAYGRRDAARGIGSGLNTLEAGLRLRYQLTRRIAPYVGVVRERAVDDTAALRAARGDARDDTRVVIGLRAVL